MAVKKSSQKIDEAVNKSVNFEVSIADIAKRSERRAWWVAIVAIVMALILLGGYFYMLPLKEKVPYVVMADAYTGTSSLARLTEDFTNRSISTSEALSRSNIAHFILARESYDSATLNTHDWVTVMTMSALSRDVFGPYQALMSSINPDNPYKVYGKRQAIRVKISSIQLSGNSGVNSSSKGATVRFQRSLYNKETGYTQPIDSKIATLSYTYRPELQMDDQSRIENPLGFQVMEYRVDNDYASPPPPESQGDASQAAQPAAGVPPAQPATSATAPAAGQVISVPQPPNLDSNATRQGAPVPTSTNGAGRP